MAHAARFKLQLPKLGAAHPTANMKTKRPLARDPWRDWDEEVHAILERFLRRGAQTHISYNFLRQAWSATLHSQDVGKFLDRLHEHFFRNNAELQELVALYKDKTVDDALILGVMRRMRFPDKTECLWKTRRVLADGLYLLEW